MATTVKCLKCGRVASARVVEDSPDISYFECEPDWKDEDQDEPTTCEHEEYDVLEVEYECFDDDVI